MTNTQQLSKSFKPSWVFAMALGAAIGWGAFILPFDWMTSGGLAGTLIGFLIGGLMITVIALCYGFTIRAMPVTGGGVAYALAALGRTHAFIAGWALTLGYTCIVALNASAVTLVFRVTFPDLFMRIPLYEVAGWVIYLPEVFVASVFIIIFAALNAMGSSLSGRFQFYAVVILLIAVAIITAAMLFYYFTERPVLSSAFPANVSPTAAVFAIVAFAPWAYVGFDSIPQLAGEFNFSPKKALSLLLWGVAAATFIYMAMMLSTSIAIGTNHAQYENVAWPPAMAIKEVMGNAGLVLMVAAVSMGVLTGLNGFFTASSRVLFTMGKTGLGSETFSHINNRFNTPTHAIVLVAALALISPWFGRAALSWVVDMTSVGITVAYFYACFCTWKIASSGSSPTETNQKLKSPVYSTIGALGCALSLGFLALLLVPGSPGALGPQSLVALALWFVFGGALYLSRRAKILAIPERTLMRNAFDL